MHTYLHGQADGVQQDQDEHQVLKIGGVDHIPDFVLVLVLRDVSPQGPGFQGIFYTLALWKRQGRVKDQPLNFGLLSQLPPNTTKPAFEACTEVRMLRRKNCCWAAIRMDLLKSSVRPDTAALCPANLSEPNSAAHRFK